MRNFLILMVLAFVATGCCHMKKACPPGCKKPCCAMKAEAAAAGEAAVDAAAATTK